MMNFKKFLLDEGLMKQISILMLTLLASCSCVNFARDDGSIQRDETSEITDNHSGKQVDEVK